MARKKPGRKRKTGPRTKSGQLSRSYKTEAQDNGTNELQAKRLALVGPGADPILSTIMPDLLFARGVLHDELAPGAQDHDGRHDVARERYDAAVRYRQIWHALFGSPWPCNAVKGPPVADDAIARLQATYDSITCDLTPTQKRLLDAVCAIDEPPHPTAYPTLRAALDRARSARTGQRAATTRHRRLLAQEPAASIEVLMRLLERDETEAIKAALGEMG